MSTSSTAHAPIAPLSGAHLVGAGLLLAAANFIAVHDTTIANVSVSTISGSLGASSSQGTYVITSYTVVEGDHGAADRLVDHALRYGARVRHVDDSVRGLFGAVWPSQFVRPADRLLDPAGAGRAVR